MRHARWPVSVRENGAQRVVLLEKAPKAQRGRNTSASTAALAVRKDDNGSRPRIPRGDQRRERKLIQARLSAFSQNTGAAPIAVPSAPDKSGMTTRAMLFAVSRSPVTSPARPGGDLSYDVLISS